MKKRIRQILSIAVLLLSVSLVSLSCGSAEDQATAAVQQKNFDALVHLLESKEFRIDIQTAHPFNTAATTQVLSQLSPYTGNTVGRINVHGAGHYLEVSGENAKGSMPYFGEQLQGGANAGKIDIGVDIDGEIADFQLIKNDKKKRVQIEFDTEDSTNPSENYEVLMTFFVNRRVEVQVTSSQRTNIRYTGSVEEIEDTSS